MKNIESMVFKRGKQLELKNKLNAGRSFLLFGARQTGKSTVLNHIFDPIPPENQIRYNLQLPSQRSIIEADPERILRDIEAKQSSNPVYLFIDEIQKVPSIMDVLQFLIDNKKVVLAASGSSARKMKRLGTNWLPGRINLEHLYPLTWEECNLPKNPSLLADHLRFGFLPAIVSRRGLEQQQEEDLTSYTHLYLEEEIRMEAVVRNLPRFTAFLKLAALESGTSPNYSKIGSQVGLSHTSIREYYQILEDTLIVHRLPAFGTSRDPVLRTPKYYFFDMGVRNAAAQIGHSKGILTLQQGLLFEHCVVLEIFAQWNHKAHLSHWRTPKGEEIDLIVEKDSKRIAIEIKSTQNPAEEDFKGLRAFAKKYSCHKSLLVCQTSQPQKFGSFFAVPWQEMHGHLDI